MSTAVVPIKHLAAGKSRLSERLARADLEELALAMLDDVVSALRATPSLDRVAVTTPDTTVAARARAAGAEALLRDDPGLNAAIDAAARELGVTGEEPWLVVLGDVAGAQADDLEVLFTALAALDERGESLGGDEGGGRGVVLAPSRDGGTGALLRTPHDAVPSLFGAASAARHREAATRAGIAYRELALPSLSVDLDRPEDLDHFLSSMGGTTGSGGAHTRALLQDLRSKARA
jgi:2-phospho-L-lactate guanylyltransferase